MKKFLFIFLLLTFASAAYANPIIVSPIPMGATIVCVIAALLLEAFLTTGALFFSGVAIGPTFLALIFSNVASYAGVLAPLAYYFEVHTLFVELAVICVETAFIKFVCRFGVFQQDTFNGLKWRYALLAAFVGNASSYYIGTLMA